MAEYHKSIVKPAFRMLAINEMRHNVMKNAAALAHYLLCAPFPLLMLAAPVLILGAEFKALLMHVHTLQQPVLAD